MWRRISYVVGLALLMVAAIAVPARADTCEELTLRSTKPKGVVSANMDGNQVVGGGDADGTGTVVLTLMEQNNKDAEVAYQIDTTNVAIPLEGAHIHKAAAGETGLSVQELFGYSQDPDRSGTVTMSKCLAHEIFHRPADYYVDVHNREFPDKGAIRGQLSDAD